MVTRDKSEPVPETPTTGDLPVAAPAPTRRPSSRRRLKIGLLSLALALLLGLVAAELWSRSYITGCFDFFRSDPELGWTHRPDWESDVILPTSEGFRKNRVRFNSLGLREREIPYAKPPNTYRILCLGDSYVEAVQVPDEAVFTRRLEDSLNSSRTGGPRFEVINGGIANYGTDQELLFYRRIGRKFSPDMVILFLFPMNDFADNLFELNFRAFYPKPFFKLENGRLVEPGSPQLPPLVASMSQGNWFTRLAGKLGIYHLGHFYMRCYLPSQARTLDRLGAFPAASQKGDNGYPLPWDVYRTPVGPRLRAAVELTEALTAQMEREVTEDGAGFLTVVVPYLPVVAEAFPDEAAAQWPETFAPGTDREQPERLANEFLRRLRSPTLDLTVPFRRAFRETGRPVLYMPDGHFNPFGHEVVARALEDLLRAEPGFGNLAGPPGEETVPVTAVGP